MTTSHEADQVYFAQLSVLASDNGHSQNKMSDILGLYVPADRQIYKAPTVYQATADRHPATNHVIQTYFHSLSLQGELTQGWLRNGVFSY